MTPDEAVEILDALGSERCRSSGRDGHVMASCPLAPWTHSGGRDRSPSCSIQTFLDSPSIYHCFSSSCGAQGRFSDLVLRVWRLKGKPDEMLDLVEHVVETEEKLEPNPIVDGCRKARSRYETPTVPQVDLDAWDDSEIEPFTGSVPGYALRRGISLSTAEAWELGYDEDRRRLTFPVRRKDGTLVGLIGRGIRQDVRPKYFNYWHFSKARFLYGEDKLSGDGRPVVLLEGPIDTLRVWQAAGEERDVLGLMGSKLSDDQAKKVLDERPQAVITFFDGDDSGDAARRKCWQRFKGRTMVLDVPMPDGVDPGDLSDETILKALSNTKMVGLE